MLDSLYVILSTISNTKIFDFIPLDLVVHFISGTFLTIFLLKRGHSLKKSFFLIVILSLAKEIFDSFTMTNKVSENLLDLFITILYPLLLFFSRELKIYLTKVDDKRHKKE